MKKLVLGLLLLIYPALALADQNVDDRLRQLEAKQAELYHTLAEKKAAGLGEKITEKITISGLIEVEASAEEIERVDGSDNAGSDIALATAQLGFGVDIAEGISGDLILLFEDGEDFTVDEAAINFANDTWFGRVGQQYVPFGVFHSHFISDPLTLELGETLETAVLGGYGNDLFSLSAYIFNGDAEKTSEQEDHIRDWGVSLIVTPAQGLELGASYISELAESDAELMLIQKADNEFEKRVGGYSAYFAYENEAYGLAGEVLGAVTDFAAADSAGDKDQPLAWNLELAWYPAEALELALRYEGSDEFVGQPEAQYGIAASWGVRENVVLSLEYLRGEFDSVYGVNEDGEVIDNRNLVTAQLGLEF